MRPLRGRLSIVLPSTVTLRSDEPVCTSGVSAWIVTASVIWPSSSLKSVRIFWSTPTCTLDMLVFLNPLISAVTLYDPVGSKGAVYSPLGSLTTLRVKPVAVFASVTVAPGSAAPDESYTVPNMVPLTAWAAAGRGDSQARRATATTAHRSTLMVHDCFIISSASDTCASAAVVGDAKDHPRGGRDRCRLHGAHTLGKLGFDIIYDLQASRQQVVFFASRFQRSPSRSTMTRARMLSHM